MGLRRILSAMAALALVGAALVRPEGDLCTQRAEPTTLVLVGVAVASLIAQRVLASRQTGSPVRDTKPTTLSIRGESFVPLVHGRHRVAPVFAWAGERYFKKESAGGGKGGGGGSSDVHIYYESGLHLVCLGPTQSIRRVWFNGKLVLDIDANVTRSTYPSGSTVDLGAKVGSFEVYWGDPDQPNSEYLDDASRYGIATRMPGITRVVWRNVRLGQNAVWPTVEYEVEVRPCSPLTRTAAWSTLPIGANPAHSLYELLAAPQPKGCGVGSLDLESFEAFGELMEDEGHAVNFKITEGGNISEMVEIVLLEAGAALVQRGGKLAIVPVRRTAPLHSGTATAGTTTTITLAAGASAVDGAYVGGVVLTKGGTGSNQARRVTGYVGSTKVLTIDGSWTAPASGTTYEIVMDPVLTDDMLVGDPPEFRGMYEKGVSDRVIYTFLDAGGAYRTRDVPTVQDGRASTRGSARTTRKTIDSVTSAPLAARVSQRLYNLDLVQQTPLTVSVVRGARMLSPGHVFWMRRSADENLSPFRVVSISRRGSEPARVQALLDHYSNDAVTAYTPPETTPPVVGTVQPDQAFTSVEVFAEAVGDSYGQPHYMLRHRANAAQVTAAVSWSLSGDSFTEAGRQSVACGGGTTDDVWAATEWGGLTSGPVFTAAVEADQSRFTDDIDPSLWMSGARLGCINDEWFAFRRVEAIGSGKYRLHGLIRGLFHSQPRDHAAGSRVYLFGSSELPAYDNVLYSLDQYIFWLSVPAGLDPTVVSPVGAAVRDVRSMYLFVDALEAYSPNVYTTANTKPAGRSRQRINSYVSGETLSVRWRFRDPADALMNAADQLGFSVPYEDSGSPIDGTGDSQGEFVVRWYNSSGVLQATDVVAAASGVTEKIVTKSSAQRTAIFGSANPSQFIVGVTCRNDVTELQESEEVRITVNLL